MASVSIWVGSETRQPNAAQMLDRMQGRVARHQRVARGHEQLRDQQHEQQHAAGHHQTKAGRTAFFLGAAELDESRLVGVGGARPRLGFGNRGRPGLALAFSAADARLHRGVRRIRDAGRLARRARWHAQDGLAVGDRGGDRFRLHRQGHVVGQGRGHQFFIDGEVPERRRMIGRRLRLGLRRDLGHDFIDRDLRRQLGRLLGRCGGRDGRHGHIEVDQRRIAVKNLLAGPAAHDAAT
jgi:hypothetical protein